MFHLNMVFGTYEIHPHSGQFARTLPRHRFGATCQAPRDERTDSSGVLIEQRLDTRVARFDTSGRSLVAAVVDLAFRYQLPTAIEYADRDATTRSLNLQFRDESVREILSRSLSMRSNSFRTES
jgi:hypothetical protein